MKWSQRAHSLFVNTLGKSSQFSGRKLRNFFREFFCDNLLFSNIFSKRCVNEKLVLTQLTTNSRDPDLLGVVIFDTRAAEGQT